MESLRHQNSFFDVWIYRAQKELVLEKTCLLAWFGGGVGSLSRSLRLRPLPGERRKSENSALSSAVHSSCHAVHWAQQLHCGSQALMTTRLAAPCPCWTVTTVTVAIAGPCTVRRRSLCYRFWVTVAQWPSDPGRPPAGYVTRPLRRRDGHAGGHGLRAT